MLDPTAIHEIVSYLLQTGMLIDIERARLAAVDQWQIAWVVNGQEPQASAPPGYVALGPWEPYAATLLQDGWKRPLGKTGGSNG